MSSVLVCLCGLQLLTRRLTAKRGTGAAACTPSALLKPESLQSLDANILTRSNLRCLAWQRCCKGLIQEQQLAPLAASKV